MTGSDLSKSAEVRRNLDHPVIDADEPRTQPFEDCETGSPKAGS